MSLILVVDEVYLGGDVTIAELDDGEMVALEGTVTQGTEWVEVMPTGQNVEDLQWGSLPLYTVVTCDQAEG
jgi:hypothetical protein